MGEIRANIKKLFFIYIIFLALYINASFIMKGRFGREHIEFTSPKQECHQGGVDWRFCLFETPRDQNDTILYFFHEKGQNENQWMDDSTYTALIQQYWEQSRGKLPKVVSVSFGPTWFVSPKMSSAESGLVEKFKAEVFGTIENKIGLVKRRFLLGLGMGGHNVLSLGLYLPKFFSRVASLCPPIYEVSPFASWATLLGVITDHGAVPKNLFLSTVTGRYMLKDEEEWKKFSPLEVIKHESIRELPPLYVSASLKDENGTYSGAARFADELRKKGAKVYWRPNSGGHCAVDTPSLAKFLSL